MTLTKKGLKSLRLSKLGKRNPQFLSGKDKFRSYQWLHQEYILKNKSLNDLAFLAGVSIACIHKWMKQAGIDRRRFCGRRGELSGSWHGGRQGGNGKYVYLYNPLHPKAYRRHVPEQVLIAEKTIGRYLSGDEIVHHINEKKDDNRPENLYLFSDGREHDRYHQKFRKGTTERITESNLL